MIGETAIARADIAIAQIHPEETDIALPEITTILHPHAKETADEETTRDHLLLPSKNAIISAENAGAPLLLPAEMIHEAYLPDPGDKKYEVQYK